DFGSGLATSPRPCSGGNMALGGRMRFLAILAFLLVMPHALAASQIEVPKLEGPVNDYADMLSDAFEQRLDAKLRRNEATTGNQVVVLTVPSLGGVSVEEYAVKVFEAWKLGDAKRDNGVLLL